MLNKKFDDVRITRPLIFLTIVSILALGITFPVTATLFDGCTFDARNGDLTSATQHGWNNPIETTTCPSSVPGSGINCRTDLTKSTSDNSLG